MEKFVEECADWDEQGKYAKNLDVFFHADFADSADF